MGQIVALMGEMRKTYKILVGRPEDKKLLDRTRCRWQDTFKMDLKYKEVLVRDCGLNSCGSGHGTEAGFCEHGNEPLGSLKDGEILE
jgi:hypothetical protein